MLSALAKPLNRYQWISEAAYFLAEARAFESGKELNDWLEAEIGFCEMLINAYMATLEEDNQPITICSLQQLASLLGIEHSDELTSKVELVHVIQNATRHRSCFQYEIHNFCREQEDCRWKSECRKLTAAWYSE